MKKNMIEALSQRGFIVLGIKEENGAIARGNFGTYEKAGFMFTDRFLFAEFAQEFLSQFFPSADTDILQEAYAGYHVAVHDLKYLVEKGIPMILNPQTFYSKHPICPKEEKHALVLTPENLWWTQHVPKPDIRQDTPKKNK